MYFIARLCLLFILFFVNHFEGTELPLEINFTVPEENLYRQHLIACNFPEGAKPTNYILCALYTIFCLVTFVIGVYFYLKNLIAQRRKNGHESNQSDISNL